MPKRYDNSVVLVFGDTHAPYHHKYTLEFLGDIASKYQPDRVIHTGDLLDIYSVSDYPKDPEHPDSWSQEIKQGRRFVSALSELFPKMEVMESNHDDRAYKKSRVAGVPREFLIPYNKVVGAPDSWKWHRDLTIRCESTRECMYFVHTKTGGSLVAAKDMGMTVAIGHHHSRFGAVAFRPKKSVTLWGIDVGCLISDKGAPYAYNKQDRGRPIQGCCVIIEGVPTMIPLR